jgi:curli biogenesis system outer membrane secretion channel CsgG
VNEEAIPELPPYSGPKARVVVKELDWGGNASSSVRVTGPDGEMVEWSVEQRQDVGADLGELIANSLTNSDRFAVLDRSILEDIERENRLAQSGVGRREHRGRRTGNLLRPDVYVVINVQEFNPHAGGSSMAGGALNWVTGSLLGAGAGYASETGKVVLQVKIVDASTSVTLKSTTVEGVAESSGFTFGALGLGAGALGGGALSQWEGKPMGAAIRKAVAMAVVEVSNKTPPKYFSHE